MVYICHRGLIYFEDIIYYSRSFVYIKIIMDNGNLLWKVMKFFKLLRN